MTTAERQDCAHVCTTEVPPANWVGHLIPAARRTDKTAKHHSYSELSDFYDWSCSETDELLQCGSRHTDNPNGTPHLWNVHLQKEIDQRHWSVTVHAVTDDFGWLVEVPTC